MIFHHEKIIFTSLVLVFVLSVIMNIETSFACKMKLTMNHIKSNEFVMKRENFKNLFPLDD